MKRQTKAKTKKRVVKKVYTIDPPEPPPAPRTIDEWLKDLEEINIRNLKESHCVMVTSIQWNELKEIIKAIRDLEDI